MTILTRFLNDERGGAVGEFAAIVGLAAAFMLSALLVIDLMDTR